MPELPEVETVRLGIIPFALNQTINKVIIRNRNFRWQIENDFVSNATNQTIIKISRRSKYLLLGTIAGTIIIHLGMSGVLLVAEKSIKLKKHDHVDLLLSNNKILRLNDPRRFGCVLWTNTEPLKHKLLVNLAPEPLSPQFNTKYLLAVLSNKKTNIKTALMNSKLVVGVGNIYANEALFSSGIHPLTIAAQLDFSELKILVGAIRRVLKQSIKLGGTTLKDFAGADGKPGYFSQQLLVYGRSGDKCTKCTTIIKHIKIANRASYFCPQCQNLKVSSI